MAFQKNLLWRSVVLIKDVKETSARWESLSARGLKYSWTVFRLKVITNVGAWMCLFRLRWWMERRKRKGDREAYETALSLIHRVCFPSRDQQVKKQQRNRHVKPLRAIGYLCILGVGLMWLPGKVICFVYTKEFSLSGGGFGYHNCWIVGSVTTHTEWYLHGPQCGLA